MADIKLENVTFYYTSPYKMIFENLSLTIDTKWRTGIIGRNGRGKTTLFRLLKKELEPSSGKLIIPFETAFFPWNIKEDRETTLNTIRNFIAPFDLWENKMDFLLGANTEYSLNEYGEILEKYEYNNGYLINNLIEKEFDQMQMSPELLSKPFSFLSAGERTRAMIVALFLKKDVYTLIDEPTNHLDIRGREILGDYLSKKDGFAMISHDRYFLDLCIDHIISLNKADIRVNSCNYSEWEYNMKLEEQRELITNEKLRKEILSLEDASKETRRRAEKKEKEKSGAFQREAGLKDKGFKSARAKGMFKLALNLEKRIDGKIEEKKGLLKNVEKDQNIKIYKDSNSPSVLLDISNLTFGYDEKLLLDNFGFSIKKGDRIAITGKNGCGKTTLFKIINGEIQNFTGDIKKPGFIKIFYSRQISEWQTGFLREHVYKNGIDEQFFRNILGTFNIRGDIFDKPLEEFSEGERKKIELCRTLIEPSSLLLWDEPLNYLDIATRQKLKEAILEYEPTILFIEHDKYFVEEIATDIIEL